jgi:hypothetical protein
MSGGVDIPSRNEIDLTKNVSHFQHFNGSAKRAHILLLVDLVHIMRLISSHFSMEVLSP